MMQKVGVMQMLEARDRRAARQNEMLARHGVPLISFTMNIAGPIKNSPLIRRGFEAGNALLRQRLACEKAQCIDFIQYDEVTGAEAFYAVIMEPLALKSVAVEIEDGIGTGRGSGDDVYPNIGRLFDMDVLRPGGKKIKREELGIAERHCLICERPARECARSRSHSLAELQAVTTAILQEYIRNEDSSTVARLASQALLYEVCTSPKPGLVDMTNNGSHKDMDIFTFMRSSAALWPYFAKCALLGMDTADGPAKQTFIELRKLGKLAEGAMLEATGGVNTHKGAIFSMGITCAALGRLPRSQWRSPETVLGECAAIARGIVAEDFAQIKPENARTAGQRLYAEYGIAGARGQVEAGFPAVLERGLPVLEQGMAQGRNLNDSGCATLLAIIGATVDTNLIARSDLTTQRNISDSINSLLLRQPYPDKAVLAQLDREFIEKNLSPGGSADLLAICYLLHFLRDA